MKYINKHDICAKYVPNMTKNPQKHLEIPQIPVAVLAMDTVGHLPVTTRGHLWAFIAVFMHMSYLFAMPISV